MIQYLGKVRPAFSKKTAKPQFFKRDFTALRGRRKPTRDVAIKPHGTNYFVYEGHHCRRIRSPRALSPHGLRRWRDVLPVVTRQLGHRLAGIQLWAGGVQQGHRLVSVWPGTGCGVVLQPVPEPGQGSAGVPGGGIPRRPGADHLLVHAGEELIFADARGVIPGGRHVGGPSSLPKGS